MVFTPELSIEEARRGMAREFAHAGFPTPDLDARLLVGHALGLDRREFLLAPERPVGDGVERLAEIMRRRLAREPVARILGAWEFWGLRFELGPATLVPRPDTETVVEAALAEIDATGGRHRKLRLVDLGTGSGAILVALLHELPQAIGLGIDLSEEAARLARSNAEQNGVGGRAMFVVGNWAESFSGRFDVIVSNPPYISSRDISDLEPEVRDHDPRQALDGGDDGLGAYRRIAAEIAPLLAMQGFAVLEIGAGQASDVTKVLANAGLPGARTRRDYAGRDRVVIARTGFPVVQTAPAFGETRKHLAQ